MTQSTFKYITKGDISAYQLLAGIRNTHDSKKEYEEFGNKILDLAEKIIQGRVKCGIPLRNDFFEMLLKIQPPKEQDDE